MRCFITLLFYGETLLCKTLFSLLYICSASWRLRPMLWYERCSFMPRGAFSIYIQIALARMEIVVVLVSSPSYVAQGYQKPHAQKDNCMNSDPGRQSLKTDVVGCILTLPNASSSSINGMIVKYLTMHSFTRIFLPACSLEYGFLNAVKTEPLVRPLRSICKWFKSRSRKTIGSDPLHC